MPTRARSAIAVKNLATGETFFHNADAVMPTASLIKIAVMIEAYQQADVGKFKLTERSHPARRGQGARQRRPHQTLQRTAQTFSLRDAIRLMIACSDNTATNMVLDRVGIAAVNKRMKDWGFPNTRLNAKVYRGDTTSVDPERTRRYGLGSTTAREMVGLLEELQIGERNRPAFKQTMLDHLTKNDGQGQVQASAACTDRGGPQGRLDPRGTHRRRAPVTRPTASSPCAC